MASKKRASPSKKSPSLVAINQKLQKVVDLQAERIELLEELLSRNGSLSDEVLPPEPPPTPKTPEQETIERLEARIQELERGPAPKMPRPQDLMGTNSSDPKKRRARTMTREASEMIDDKMGRGPFSHRSVELGRSRMQKGAIAPSYNE